MFISEEFKKAWEEWKQHKAEKHNLPYTKIAETKALSALYWKCDGREQLAIDSISHSIEHNWSAIYLKPTDDGKSINGGYQQPNSKKGGTSTDRMEAARNW